MCPFLDEDREEGDFPLKNTFDRGMSSNFFKNDRKYLFIGGTAIVVVFFVVIVLIRSNSSSVNLEELPVIQAEKTPFKEKPAFNKEVQHQDKVVYDNISGDQRAFVEKVAPQPESVLTIPEVDVSESLSDEEKRDIIRAFDELAPEKEYKINYVKEKQGSNTSKGSERVSFKSLTHDENKLFQKLKDKRKLSNAERKRLSELTKKAANSYKSEVSENESLPPINVVGGRKRKHRLKDLVAERSAKHELAEKVKSSPRGTIMVQIASVGTRAAAESEYNRILLKNRFLKGKGKKIFKVDLGEPKGIRYRIQVGPFENKEEARKIVSAMRNNGCESYISK